MPDPNDNDLLRIHVVGNPVSVEFKSPPMAGDGSNLVGG